MFICLEALSRQLLLSKVWLWFIVISCINSENFSGPAVAVEPVVDAAAVTTPVQTRTLFIIRLYPKFINSAGRIPKPSQRLQNIDPLATLTKPTPALPKATRQKLNQKPQTPTHQRGHHPARPASIYASRQIQKSQNRHAVSVLFTPHSRRQPSQALGTQRWQHQPVSPSPLVRNPKNLTSLDDYNIPGDSGQYSEANPEIPGSDSDSDQDIRFGIKSLNLTSGKSLTVRH